MYNLFIKKNTFMFFIRNFVVIGSLNYILPQNIQKIDLRFVEDH